MHNYKNIKTWLRKYFQIHDNVISAICDNMISAISDNVILATNDISVSDYM